MPRANKPHPKELQLANAYNPKGVRAVYSEGYAEDLIAGHLGFPNIRKFGRFIQHLSVLRISRIVRDEREMHGWGSRSDSFPRLVTVVNAISSHMQITDQDYALDIPLPASIDKARGKNVCDRQVLTVLIACRRLVAECPSSANVFPKDGGPAGRGDHTVRGMHLENLHRAYRVVRYYCHWMGIRKLRNMIKTERHKTAKPVYYITDADIAADKGSRAHTRNMEKEGVEYGRPITPYARTSHAHSGHFASAMPTTGLHSTAPPSPRVKHESPDDNFSFLAETRPTAENPSFRTTHRVASEATSIFPTPAPNLQRHKLIGPTAAQIDSFVSDFKTGYSFGSSRSVAIKGDRIAARLRKRLENGWTERAIIISEARDELAKMKKHIWKRALALGSDDDDASESVEDSDASESAEDSDAEDSAGDSDD